MSSLPHLKRQRVVLLSPLIVLILGYVMARVGGELLGVWVWIPLILAYWGLLAFFMFWGAGRETMRMWLRPAQGAPGWSVLAVLVGLIPLPILLMNWSLLRALTVWVPWLLFALINPWFEEGYWRGLLLDASATWKGWLRVLYTSGLFALSHPALWGVNSIGNRTITVIVSTFVMGIVWAVVYHKTRSLRWVIVAHILVDLLNMAVPVFLNLYAPQAF
jgi:membrane protease YdiL (CAAX protease family)